MDKRFIDMTGKKFGRWTVLEFAGQNKYKHSMWKCECECGTIKIVEGKSLRNGTSVSCDCLRRGIISENQFKDITNQRFGKLVALKYTGEKDKWGNSLWLTLCDCGNTNIVSVSILLSGKSKSCGCSSKDMGIKRRKDLTGKTFGMLYVKEFYCSDKWQHSKFVCTCECGREIIVSGYSLINGATTSCGCRKESNIATSMKKYFCTNYGAIAEYKILKSPESNRWLPFDIYLPNENVYIEVNGSQHYEYVNFWDKSYAAFLKAKKRDRFKKEFAELNGTYIEIDIREIKKPKDAIKYVEDILKSVSIN